VHLPWCIRKCPYCDFNSYRLGGELPESDYVDALLRDLESELQFAGGRVLESVFIGGGTPSLFSGAAITRLLAEVRSAIAFAPDIEVTLEANPGAAETARFAEFRDAGVTRLSIGVQSFRDERLRTLGRVHGVAQAEAAIGAALDAEFAAVNIDIMYGLPGDGRDDGLFDLRSALEFGTQHVSWYQLTLEPNTAFHRNPPPLPDDDEIAELERAGRALLSARGFERYEVSAYAQTGSRCRHNVNYWSFGDYIGIGAGAHGKLTLARGDGIMRRSKQRNPRTYMQFAGQDAGVAVEVMREPQKLVLEYLMNALRLSEGVDARELEARTGVAVATLQPQLNAARAAGWLEPDPQRLKTTEAGSHQLNQLLMLFC
jgi:oxygen-independent coproporphyrinogen-3 oxidase